MEGGGVHLTSFLDSLHMDSYYLPIQSKALQAIINEIKAQNTAILESAFDPLRKEVMVNQKGSVHKVS